jgi:hypothetical protein
LCPVKYIEVELKEVAINNMQIYVPVSGQYCWNSALPCSIFQNNIGITNIELRGKDLSEGFRVKN